MPINWMTWTRNQIIHFNYNYNFNYIQKCMRAMGGH